MATRLPPLTRAPPNSTTYQDEATPALTSKNAAQGQASSNPSPSNLVVITLSSHQSPAPLN